MLNAVIVKGTTLLYTVAPPCCTYRPPGEVPVGTVATICVSVQLTMVPYVLYILKIPLPCALPNPVPVTVICMPTAKLVGEILVIVGGIMVNCTTLL
jgi:hypothetical protein